MSANQQQTGFLHEEARIQAVSFPEGAIELQLQDGRQVKAPIERFPEIAALSSEARQRYKLLAGIGIMFEDAATVLHISDFLGLENRQGL